MALTYRKSHIPDFRRLRRVLTAEANAVLERETEAFAEAEATRFRRDIERQVFRSFREHPLTPAYFARKRRAGLDERILIATGWYTDHIRVWRHRSPSGNTRERYWRVGFHPTVLARDAKGRRVPITLDRLARVHEFGSAIHRIPARPHWNVHLRAMRERAHDVRARIRREILRRLRLRWPRFA
jgi:hypothetical protein